MSSGFPSVGEPPTKEWVGQMADSIRSSTVPVGSTEQWYDKKRYLWLIGLVVPSLAFVALGGCTR